MSKSQKKHKSSTNKGYPRWVAEKYGTASAPHHVNQQTLNMTATHSEGAPGSTVSQRSQVETEATGGSGEAPAGVSVIGTFTSAPQEAELQIVQASSSSNLPIDSAALDAEGAATEGEQQRVGGRSDKRADPQNVAEFIEAFLAGKVKSLSEPVAKRLKSSSPHLEAGVRGDLLRRAQSVDSTLDKVRKLMLVAKELSSHKPLAYLLMDFCVDCTLMNPFVRAEGMQSLLFPGHHDASSLEEAWTRLQSLPIPAEANVSLGRLEVGTLHDNAPLNSEEAHAVDTAKDNAAKSQRAIATLAGRSRRNALLCAAIWRLQQGQMAFLEMVRALRSTLFSLKKRPKSLEDELLEALASVSDKDAEPMALLLEWSARQQTEAINRLADANRRACALDDEVRELKESLALTLARVDTLQTQLADERAAGQALQAALGVAKTHGQADLEGLRALALNTLRDAVSQLDVVSEALKREPPKVLSALDKVDAVMDRLKATNGKLENT